MPPSSQKKILNVNAISLFSGAGGASLGVSRAGFQVVAFSEIKKSAINTHFKEFPGCRLLTSPDTASADILKIPDSVFEYYRGSCHLLVGTPPCQGFSNAGRKRADLGRELIYQFVRATDIIRPTYIICENVPGLVARKGKDPESGRMEFVIDIIRNLFKKIGYSITYKVLKATDYGVPQDRKSLIIVGVKDSMQPFRFNKPLSDSCQAVRPILDTCLKGAIEIHEDNLPQVGAHMWIETTERNPTGIPHPKLVELVVVGNTNSKLLGAQLINPDKPCRLLGASYAKSPKIFVGLYNKDEGRWWLRCLTVRELSQIQGFPADYTWIHGVDSDDAIQQIGNAGIPAIFESIARCLLG